ncbi:MAG: GAF domain-containing protein [Candidatus Rokubacteria bacterium]|nr:GAF domain-containing protein [Candidatus Rokubacteria bacterium]
MFGSGPAARPAKEPADGGRPARPAQIIDFTRLREVTSKLVRLEAELEAIFRAFPDVYFWLDAPGTILAFEAGRGADFAQPLELMVGKRIGDAFPPEWGAPLEAAAAEAIGTGAPVSVEFALAASGADRAEGGERSYEARFVPLPARGPAERQLLMIVRDIAERKRAENATKALANAGRELAATLDVAQAVERVVAAALQVCRVRSAALFTLDRAASRLTCVAVSGVREPAAWVGRTLALGDGITGRAVLEARRVGSTDVRRDVRATIPEWLQAAASAEGLGAVLSVPLAWRGEVLGALTLADAAGRVFAAHELEMVAGLASSAALTLQNARLYDETVRRRREAEVIAELARSLNASLELDVVLQRVADGSRELCGADMAAIGLREPDSDAVILQYRSGYVVPEPVRIEPGQGIGGQTLLTGRPFRTDRYIEDARISRDFDRQIRERGIVSSLVVPITPGRRVEGLLYVHNRSPRPFTDRDESILVRLADHAAVAIRNARLFEASESRRHAAEALADVGRLISQSLDPDVVAQRIADSVLTLLGARASELLRIADESGELVAMAAAGHVDSGVVRGAHFPAGEGAAGLAIRTREPVMTPDLPGDARVILAPALREVFARSAWQATLAVPLLVQDRAIGALVVKDRTGRRFDDEDARLLQAFAGQAALALENARVFQETERGRARAQAAAVDSAERFASLVRGLTAIVWEGDAATWQTLFISEAAEDILGYPLIRWYTEPDFWLAHVHPDDRERFRGMRPTTRTDDHELEYRMIAADGRVVWFSDLVHAVRSADGRVRRLHGVMVDITETKRAKEAARVLGDLGRALGHAPDAGPVSRQVAESVRRLFGASAAALYRADRETGAMALIAVAYEAGVSFEWNAELPAGAGAIGLAARERRAVVSRDVVTDPRIVFPPEARARAERGGVRSALAVPLLVKGQVVGALIVGEGAGRTFTDREVILAEAFASQAAFALT